MRIIILRPLFALSGKRDRVSFKFRRKTFETKNYIRPPLAPLNGIYSRNHGETCLCRAIIPRIFIVSLLSTHFIFLSFFTPYLPSPKSGTLYRNNAIPSRFDLNRSNRSKSIFSIAMGIEESTRKYLADSQTYHNFRFTIKVGQFRRPMLSRSASRSVP